MITSQNLIQYLSNIRGNYGVKDLHKTAILDTAQITNIAERTDVNGQDIQHGK